MLNSYDIAFNVSKYKDIRKGDFEIEFNENSL